MQSCLRLLTVALLTAANAGPVLANAPKVVRSAKSGPWSAATTWEGGQVPSAGTKVLIREGHAVAYDVKADAVLRTLHIAGALVFATDRDTELNVGLIKIQHGETLDENGFDCLTHPKKGDDKAPPAASVPLNALSAACLCCDGKPALLVGTLEQPITAGKTAKIRLHYIDGMDKESCPAIICCGGRMDFHGAPLNRTWVKLGATIPAARAKGEGTAAVSPTVEITLAEPVTGWRPGDRIIVTGTTGYNAKTITEERMIKAVADRRITLDKPLAYPHVIEGDRRGEVANLSRNVVVESAEPAGVRGHTMYHRHSAGSISYAEFCHLGKRDMLGKYSLHYHLCGDTMRGASVVGASIWDSHNRWLTIHGTQYLVVRDCVGYQSVGHGFFLEDGTEVYNVLDRNLAVAARNGKPLPKQLLPFDPNDGAGFWWANSLNTFTRNVASDCDGYGFRFEATPSTVPSRLAGSESRNRDKGQPLDLVLPVRRPDGSSERMDIRTLPFVRFEGNEAHNIREWGLNLGEFVGGVGPDPKTPFVIRDMKIWTCGKGYTVQSPSVLIDGMTIHETVYGVWGSTYKAQDYRNVVLTRIRKDQNGGKGWDNSSDDKENASGQTRVRLPGQSGTMGDGGNRLQPSEIEVAKLNPVDQLPPITVMTHVRTMSDSKLLVRGTTSDNGALKRVTVNGREAKLGPQGDWEITLDNLKSGPVKLAALAEDVAGNTEKTPHELTVAIR